MAVWAVIGADSDRLTDDAVDLPTLVVSPNVEARSDSVSARLILESGVVDVASDTGGTVSRTVPLPARLGAGQDLLWIEIDGSPKVLSVFAADRAFYRTLQRGDRGSDVSLLQEFLTDRGHYAADIDDRFGSELERALVSWRSSIGAGDSKVLVPGDITFVPEGRLVAEDGVAPGAILAPGEQALVVRTDAITFRIRLHFVDAVALEPGYAVEGEEFAGTISEIAPDPTIVDGQSYLDLLVEGDLLADRRPGETLAVRIAPPADPQMWIPASAVATDAQGDTFVVLEAGAVVAVAVGKELDGSVPVVGLDEDHDVVVPNPYLMSDGS